MVRLRGVLKHVNLVLEFCAKRSIYIDVKDKVSFEDLIRNEVVIMQTSKCLEALESS